MVSIIWLGIWLGFENTMTLFPVAIALNVFVAHIDVMLPLIVMFAVCHTDLVAKYNSDENELMAVMKVDTYSRIE